MKLGIRLTLLCLALGFGSARAHESVTSADNSKLLLKTLACPKFPKGESDASFAALNKKCNSTQYDEAEKFNCYSLGTKCMILSETQSKSSGERLSEKLESKNCGKKSLKDADACYFSVLTEIQTKSQTADLSGTPAGQ